MCPVYSCGQDTTAGNVATLYLFTGDTKNVLNTSTLLLTVVTTMKLELKLKLSLNYHIAKHVRVAFSCSVNFNVLDHDHTKFHRQTFSSSTRALLLAVCPI